MKATFFRGVKIVQCKGKPFHVILRRSLPKDLAWQYPDYSQGEYPDGRFPVEDGKGQLRPIDKLVAHFQQFPHQDQHADNEHEPGNCYTLKSG